jgi:predicted dehydrogenase
MTAKITRRRSLQQLALAGLTVTGASLGRPLARATEPRLASVGPSAGKLRMGVCGLGGRGINWIGALGAHDDIEVVAACDITPASVAAAKHFHPNLVYYDALEKMLEHEIDAVFVVTPAFRHATDAIAALRAGKHVLSEVTACWTMAEAVALYEAAKESKSLYAFGENYCYFYHMLEMKKQYGQGVIGGLNYANCSYYAAYRTTWIPFCKHQFEWRNWMPQSYYSSHVVGPLLYATGLRPVAVSGLESPNAEPSRSIGKVTDEVASFTVKLNNGATAHFVNDFMSAKYTFLWWFLSGDKGSMENDRVGGGLHVFTDTGVAHLTPTAPHSAEKAAAAGHGGSDYFLIYDFVRAVKGDAPPAIDVRTGVEMTMPGILAHRSALAGGQWLEVPDLDQPAVRDRYRHDTATPFTIDNQPGDEPPSVLGTPVPDSGVWVDATIGDDPASIAEKLAAYGMTGWKV